MKRKKERCGEKAAGPEGKGERGAGKGRRDERVEREAWGEGQMKTPRRNEAGIRPA